MTVESARLNMDDCAEAFLILSLEVSHLDDDSMDMYFGPDALRLAAEQTMQAALSARERSVLLEERIARLSSLDEQVRTLVNDHANDSDICYRGEWIAAEVGALRARLQQLREGKRLTAATDTSTTTDDKETSDDCIVDADGRYMSFSNQCQQFYNIPCDDEAWQQQFFLESLPASRLDELDSKLTFIERALVMEDNATTARPTSLAQRFDRVRDQFLVPKESYKDLFLLSLEECRRRCAKKNLVCPRVPKMVWEDSKDMAWEAFEVFKGDGASQMQVNLFRLLSIDKFLQLPAHEAYPGHHFMCSLVEEKIVKGKGWLEFSVVNTFSPASFIAEGGAEWGSQALLWGNRQDRIDFMMTLINRMMESSTTSDKKDMSALPPAFRKNCHASERAELVAAWCDAAMITDPLDQIGRVHCRIARDLTQGRLSTAAARTQMLEAGFRRDESWPNVDFMLWGGAYIVNYSFAKTAVQSWIDRMINDGEAQDEWEAFALFAARPPTPGQMVRQLL